MSYLYDYKKNNIKSFIIKSPKLNGAIVENILLLLHPQQKMSVSELLFETNRKLPLISCKILKKYLVYLIDYELISYSGQRHVCLIEDNGLELLERIDREKKSSLTNSEDIMITIERGN